MNKSVLPDKKDAECWKKLEVLLQPGNTGFFVPKIQASITVVLDRTNIEGLLRVLSKCGYR